MRRWIWIIPFCTMTVLGACAPESPDAGMNDSATGDPTLAAPTCQPSEGMPLEGRASPYDSATITVGDGAAKICYGRPSLRGREMIGGEAVPYGELWRTGANEPTIVHINVPARIADIHVEPGSYSLYTIPQAGLEWTLIVNRSISQWGHESRYTEEVAAQEVGRAQVRAEALDDRVEQLTIRPAERQEGAVLEWQNTRVLIPIDPA
jgi:hypothetical protein